MRGCSLRQPCGLSAGEARLPARPACGWPLVLVLPRARILAAAGLLWIACTGTPGRPEPADLVLQGGAVYTLDAARSWAEAAAVRGDTIVYVGPDAGAARFIGPDTQVVDLAGRMLLPGFQA